MASAKIRAKCGDYWIEVDAGSTMEAMEALSEYLEVFSQARCLVCNEENVVPVHRKAESRDGKKYDFYEMKCLKCGAKLEFGQSMEGKLFPRRKNKDNSYRENMGWFQWEGTQAESQAEASTHERGF